VIKNNNGMLILSINQYARCFNFIVVHHALAPQIFPFTLFNKRGLPEAAKSEWRFSNIDWPLCGIFYIAIANLIKMRRCTSSLN
jgi:hypothetical protein